MFDMSADKHTAGITVGELIVHLKAFSHDDELHIGGLHFYRLKRRGDHLVQMEFSEQVYRDKQGTLIAEDIVPSA